MNDCTAELGSRTLGFQHVDLQQQYRSRTIRRWDADCLAYAAPRGQPHRPAGSLNTETPNTGSCLVCGLTEVDTPPTSSQQKTAPHEGVEDAPSAASPIRLAGGDVPPWPWRVTRSAPQRSRIMNE